MATQETLKHPQLMPFGAHVLAEGGVRFRLWAPAARSVDLMVGGRARLMHKQAGGWFELVDARSGPGTLYQYRIDGGQLVPDPASRFQPHDVGGASEVIDPGSYPWKDAGWRNRPWREAVIYELHVGTFTPEGTYRAAIGKLRSLAELGITAIELMPLSDFAGRRNWGYDGVLPYAPDSAYGRPEDLEALVEAAHEAGLMVFLDVVYNHFGPKGNYLGLYAPEFFTERYQTPWGAAINFQHEVVRQYFVHNVLYWLHEYHFDGLRFDAVHAIIDPSPRHILDEIRAAVPADKHLVLENDEGFAYQGEVSPFTKDPRGEKSSHLPASCFVDFLQNHDQVGNRARGERLTQLADPKVLKALTAIQLLAPSPPLIFMGEEWGCRQPFLFFCDFDGELGESVRKGRREEFSRFKSFREDIPDPLAEGTFKASTLDWSKADQVWLAHYKQLLALRQRHVVPLDCGPGRYRMLGERAFAVTWDRLLLIANCGDEAVSVRDAPSGKPLWSNGAPGTPWSVNWWLTQ